MRAFNTLPRPGLGRLALRCLRWARAIGRLGLRLGVDMARRRRGQARLGRRLRQLFEDVGGTGVKVGQQLSLRSDLLPPEVCAELAALVDDVDPMPGREARAILEASLGRGVDELFSSFEDDPIGSASVACVYRARLRDGDEVAVKVRRPEAAARFAEDLVVFNAVCHLLERSTFVREGTFHHLRRDLRMMFSEELDLRREARYQRLFRRIVRGKRLPYVSAPRVYSELCREDVLVSAYVHGVSARTLLAAVEGGDQALLDRLAAQDIDPKVVSHRVLLMSLWARFEAPFFHADPHPGNLVVQPGNRLVLLDFGACGTTSRLTRLNQNDVIRQMIRRDASRMANVMVVDNTPLPHIDLDAFREEMEAHFADFVLALEDRDAPWPERLIATIWLRMMEVTREFQIRMNLDTVRSIRAFLLYDTLAFRLYSQHRLGIMREYLQDAAWRRARALQRQIGRLSPAQRRRRRLRWRLDVLDRVQERVAQLEPMMETAQLSFERAGELSLRALRLGVSTLFWGSMGGLLLSLGRVDAFGLLQRVELRPALALLGLFILVRWVRFAALALRQVEVDHGLRL